MGGSEGAAKDGEEFDDGVPGRKNSSSFGLSSRRETLGLRRGWKFIEQRGVGLEGSGLPGGGWAPSWGKCKQPREGLQDGGKIRKQLSINPSN